MQTSVRLLTITHLYGSGGSLIAQELGKRLRWTVWDKDFIRRIAAQYAVAEEYVDAKDERVDSFIERMVGLFGMGGFESAYQVPPPLWLNDSQLARMTKALIEDIAKEGNAIVVGRGAQYVLAERPDTLHVFIFASQETRVERVMRTEGFEHDAALERVKGMDRIRSDYAQKFYEGDWRDPSHYHLLIDADLWGDEGTADLIMWAIEHRSKQ